MKTMSKKSFVEKTEDMKIRAKDLFAAGKQKYGEIRSKPIWGRMRKGIESTAEVVGKGTRGQQRGTTLSWATIGSLILLSLAKDDDAATTSTGGRPLDSQSG